MSENSSELPSSMPDKGSVAALEELLRENIELSKHIFGQNKKIQRRMTFMAISEGLRLLFIVVPIVLAIIYLPPLLKPVLNQYQELLQTSSIINDNKDSVGQLLKMLK
jgi:hypothetical protein